MLVTANDYHLWDVGSESNRWIDGKFREITFFGDDLHFLVGFHKLGRDS